MEACVCVAVCALMRVSVHYVSAVKTARRIRTIRVSACQSLYPLNSSFQHVDQSVLSAGTTTTTTYSTHRGARDLLLFHFKPLIKTFIIQIHYGPGPESGLILMKWHSQGDFTS